MTGASAAYLVVRAVLADAADRPAFDRWYAEEHLPDAMAAFGVAHAWRCWSLADPLVHYAQYRFPHAEAANAAMESDAIRALIS